MSRVILVGILLLAMVGGATAETASTSITKSEVRVAEQRAFIKGALFQKMQIRAFANIVIGDCVAAKKDMESARSLIPNYFSEASVPYDIVKDIEAEYYKKCK